MGFFLCVFFYRRLRICSFFGVFAPGHYYFPWKKVSQKTLVQNNIRDGDRIKNCMLTILLHIRAGYQKVTSSNPGEGDL